MKSVLRFLIEGIIFFIVVFGLMYAAEAWFFHVGKTVGKLAFESGVAAVVFVILLEMIGSRREQEEIRAEQKHRERIAELESRRPSNRKQK